jgi:hypothetical protein
MRASATLIFLMRHLANHLFFLLAALGGYVLFYRLFRNKLLACLGFVMLVFSPRIYAHSFFNCKDIPFLSAVLLTIVISEIAFCKNKPWAFAALGLMTGFATSIRIMGVLLFLIIISMLLVDLVRVIKNREKPTRHLINLFGFATSWVAVVLLGWPYLWSSPAKNFARAFIDLSHYNAWNGTVLFQGTNYVAELNAMLRDREVWLVVDCAAVIHVCPKNFAAEIC